MLAYRKWVLSLGIAAVTPGIALAGPLPFSESDQSATSSSSADNQKQIRKTISRITKAISQSGVRGHAIDLRYSGGVATLIGTAQSPDDVARLTKVISRVPGVRQVNNQLQAPGMAPPARPATAQRSAVQQLAMQPATQGQGQGQGQTQAQESSNNQKTAEKIAQALAENQLSGLDIEVRYNSGVATLSGAVPHPQAAAIAHQVTKSVPGVQQVRNELLVPQPPQGPQMAGGPSAADPRMAARGPARAIRRPVPGARGPAPAGSHRPHGPYGPHGPPGAYGPHGSHGPIRPVSHQRGGPNPAMLAAGAAAGAMGMAPPGAGGRPGPPAHGTRNPSHLAYDLPNLPKHSWPTYAAYPNSAQISYPKQYGASAWPYIGPFYPYPQVPLGWRQAQLEWDDGSWNLNFRPRTDKWFWYLDPENW